MVDDSDKESKENELFYEDSQTFNGCHHDESGYSSGKEDWNCLWQGSRKETSLVAKLAKNLKSLNQTFYKCLP